MKIDLTHHPWQAWLPDGSEVRRCPLDLTDGKILYCTRDARFFSHRWLLNPDTGRFEWTFNEIQPNYRPNAPSRTSGGWANYMIMRQFGSEYCHTLVLSTWDKPRPGPDYEADHLDGNTLNNHIDNLEWVTRAENAFRRWTCYTLNEKKINPIEDGIPGLRKWFAIARAIRMSGQKLRDLSRDFLLTQYHSFQLVDPSKIMDYDLTHHMEE